MTPQAMLALATAVPRPVQARDLSFLSWLSEGLVWLPERGMGFYPVTAQPYDAAYFDKYRGYARTEQGQAITAARVELVQRHLYGPAPLCDVGIGCGDFVTEMAKRSPLLEVYGYDINATGVEWLTSQRRYHNPWVEAVTALTLWDALEHIQDAASLLLGAQEWVFCSLPIVPGDGSPPADWKHLRRDEHVWYWTRAGLIRWMAEQGFECVECNAMETLLGREDIESFAFRRVG